MTSSDLWDADDAARYDVAVAAMFEPQVLDPTVDLLAELAGPGPVLEFAIGTGRVAIPLAARGLSVTGLECSQPMIDVLHEKAPELPVIPGDMASTLVSGSFSLVYLVFNTIGNLRTQAEQVECFRNAARHLLPGGRFVVEVGVPSLRRLPPGQAAVPFDLSERHLGFDTYDLVTQQAISHHFTRQADGSYHRGTHNFRCVWPSELDLMAQLAGMELESRYAGWSREPFTGESESHVSIWRLPV